MPSNSPTSTEAHRPSHTSGEPYEAPRLIYLGHVSTLLAAASTSIVYDGSEPCNARTATDDCPNP
jgi:hypothetical protein